MTTSVFTAREIATALQTPKRTVLETLRPVKSNDLKIISGNATRAWSKDALPQNILVALEEIASRRKTSVDELLASPPPFWRPPYPLAQLCEEAIERASLLQSALAPAVARLSDGNLASAEFEQLGVEDYRRAFGHAISKRHWRRLFKRTLQRDDGAENWGRLEIYLDESPARKAEFRKRVPWTPTALQPLRELISSFENPASPTDLEKDCLWIYAFEHYEQEAERFGKPRAIKRATLKFLFENASFLGKSEKGIRVQFDRKLKRWIAGGRVPAAIADARRKNPGRPAPKFSEQEEHALIAKSLRSGGGLAQAWRHCRETGAVNAQIMQRYIANPASKSYVPSRVRRLITNKVKILRDHHHGPRRAKLNGAYINRDPSTFNAGDWFQADDCTLPNYYYTGTHEGFVLGTRSVPRHVRCPNHVHSWVCAYSAAQLHRPSHSKPDHSRGRSLRSAETRILL